MSAPIELNQRTVSPTTVLEVLVNVFLDGASDPYGWAMRETLDEADSQISELAYREMESFT